MPDFVTPMMEIAKQAGEILMSKIGRLTQVEHKGWANLVTEADTASEKLIVERWLKLFPDHAFLGEEQGSLAGSSGSPFKLIVDPLDGTTNYAHGFPFFAVSMGLEENDQPVAGVVYAPHLQEMFSAQKGQGAYLNGKRLCVSEVDKLEDSLLCTGFSYKMWEKKVNNLDHFTDFMKVSQSVRRPGAASLDLSYVASGRLDGFWELDLNPWDVSAGIMIIMEAGGQVTDFQGKPYCHGSPQILVSNGKLHGQMLDVLQKSKV